MASSGKAAFAFSLLWCVLTAYSVLSSIDFGAGFYLWRSEVSGREDVKTVTLRYLSPLWETTNVFLILFVVGMVGFFPASARVFGTAMLIPASIAVIALVMRGACFASAHLAGGHTPRLSALAALSGLAVLPSFAAFVSSGVDGSIMQGARGQVLVGAGRLWLSPLHVLLMVMGLLLPLYLGPLVLSWYAMRHGEASVSAFYRRAARRVLLPLAAVAVGVFFALRATSSFQSQALDALWPGHLVLGSLFVLASGALYTRRFHTGLAASVGVLQVAGVLLLVGFSRLPYLVYPSLQLDAALTPAAMYTALILTVAGGLVVLAPSLALLYLLFVRPNQWLLPVAADDGLSLNLAGMPDPSVGGESLHKPAGDQMPDATASGASRHATGRELAHST